MAKAKTGDKLSCEVCGMIVTVDEECGCVSMEELICCGEVMGKGEAAARRARKAAAAAAPAAKKAVKKKAKPAAKKKAAPKKKPAAKKKAVAKKKVKKVAKKK